MKQPVLPLAFVGLLTLLPACGPSPQQQFVSVVQRELNDTSKGQAKDVSAIRGYRVSESGVVLVLDSRYDKFDDSARLAGLEGSLSLDMIDGALQYGEYRSNFHPDEKTFQVSEQLDTGRTVFHESLRDLRKELKSSGASTHIDAAAWDRSRSKRPESPLVTPAPLNPLRDSCTAAFKDVSKASDQAQHVSSSAALETLQKSSIDIDKCVTNHHYEAAAMASFVRALAEHQQGNDSDAATDAQLASQQFSKCSTELYGSRDGAECETRASDMATLQAHWALGM